MARAEARHMMAMFPGFDSVDSTRHFEGRIGANRALVHHATLCVRGQLSQASLDHRIQAMLTAEPINPRICRRCGCFGWNRIAPARPKSSIGWCPRPRRCPGRLAPGTPNTFDLRQGSDKCLHIPATRLRCLWRWPCCLRWQSLCARSQAGLGVKI